MTVVKSLKPIRDKIIVSDMHFGDEKTAGGLIVLSDDGKGQGIKPRWARVWAVGPEQQDVTVGEWILIEHGRWTRTIKFENDDETITELRVVDNDAVLIASDYRPNDIRRGIAAGPGSNFNFNIPGA